MDGLGFANLGHPFLPAAPDFIPFPFGRRGRRHVWLLSFFLFFLLKNFFMKNANDDLRDFTGTQDWYRHFTGLLFTDGVLAMAEKFQAFWLIDLVFSHQVTPEVKAQPFQKWVLKRTEGDCFLAVADDGNGVVIAEQVIPYSDFAADQVTLFYTAGVLLLPSEY